MQIFDIHNDTELTDVARLFYGDSIPSISLQGNNGIYTVIIDNIEYYIEYNTMIYSYIPADKREKRLAKIALYDVLSKLTGRSMKWGALTGVRPTKLFYEAIGLGYFDPKTLMTDLYRVSADRANILSDIIVAQKGKLVYPNEYINLYIHIPYCTTRCSYCSFVSELVGKRPEQAEEYVRLLCDEIKQTLLFLRSSGKKLLSVYIGGGTPTALNARLFGDVLNAIGDNGCEYTCEAGRPDTVDIQKADIMSDCGVTRVCVNPQTLNEKTLSDIGRSHSVKDFYLAYDIINSRKFDINCDLIAGLFGESADDFINSFNGVKALKPQNITIHSLSKKNGAALRYTAEENSSVSDMIDHALNNRGEYRPYYLYRQKRQAGNLENFGLSVVGKECVNNITTMEETVSVMACGAGAISKAVFNGGISRFANLRDIGLYIKQYDQRLKAKLDFFDSVFKNA